MNHSRVLDTLVKNLEGMAYRCLHDRHWTMIFVSQGCQELCGYAPAEMVENNTVSWEEITHPEDRLRIRQQIEAAVRSGQRFAVQYRIVTQSGQVKWVAERGIAIHDEQGEVAIEGFIEDITARRATLEALGEAELRYRHIFEHASEGIFQSTRDGRYLAANPALARLYGYESAAELIADLGDIERRLYVLPNRRRDFLHQIETHGAVLNFESEVYRRDGSRIWISENAHTVHDPKGEFTCYEGTVQDISERKKTEAHLRLLAMVFSNSNEAIIVTDGDNRIVATNPAFSVLTGYQPEDVMGKNPRVLSAGTTPPEVFKEMWTGLQQDGAWQGELWDRRKSGEAYPKWLSISLVRDEAGQVRNHIGSFIDISELKATQERIRHLAHHDTLTDLPNRYSLQKKLEQAVAICKRNHMQMALMLIDLDRFKTINDTLGHQAGDELLIQVAQRLNGAVRESDIVARLGGDEFVVALPGISSPADAAHLADKIGREISLPYQINGQEQRTTPSIGICLYPGDSTEIGDLLKNADVAMYHAKAKGRGNFQFFTEDMNVATTERMSIEADLRLALAHGEFLLHYQPQLDLRSGTIVGVEALIRWQHPTRGLVPPGDFIPIAEESGMIAAIGDWVLEEACRQLSVWQQKGISHLRMSINLSSGQFLDKTLPIRIHELLASNNLSAHLLDLEVTESMSMASPDESISVMKTLRSSGLTLSIDDFGTGYSSLAYLKLLPINTLKIDRSFVKDIESDPNDADICDVTVLLAHKLGLEVVAEGVETEAQLKFLLSIGCEKIQGYLISKPLAAEQAEQFIRNNRPMADLGTIDLWSSAEPSELVPDYAKA
ncbi:bifunctional diguanylate cyclase/phosphodiesterase [Dechloromonas denitrificans]|uniref:sensor domain-containing protein n=1 Tax=Dechloromonas denitrificans TaxID=281362 RepID=UPI001CF837CA|nr:bifunctional diguanylate cyclase/phosphodiesterase [Dechloromonas denitrificans]UCV04667.1 EAL domain-containing protein [Dechloromonas denitrificans]UCV09035.1 EAL domain-containing protein [Dechloromonas denitrificans]